jgi:hypothetical protein
MAIQPQVPNRPAVMLDQNDPSQHAESVSAVSPTTALYSDVVARRPPSPGKETMASVARRAVNSHSENETSVVNSPTKKIIETATSDESESPKVGETGAPWITVSRRRAHSLTSLNKTRKVSQGLRQPTNLLTVEQALAIQAAAEGLTSQQKETLRRRQKKVSADRDHSISSRGEGPSRPTGKGIDPREWGNVNISSESLDLNAQAAALDSLAQKNRSKRREAKSHNKHTYPRDRRSKSMQLPAESRPVAQIAAGSYLGTALRNVGRSVGRPQPGDEYPFSSDSESTDSSYSPSVGKGSTGFEGPDPDPPLDRYYHRRRENRHGRNKRRRSPTSSPEPVIRPIAPKEYDGRPDARLFHRFVKESEAYLKDGKVKSRRQVFLLSYHLTGKAYDFYTQRVSLNEEAWTLREFYSELFNYCFPVDYRMQLRRNLARCHQNDKSVAEYTHELQELFNMIGDIPERDRVLKFWNSSRPVIQKGLWRDNLNPETSTWD